MSTDRLQQMNNALGHLGPVRLSAVDEDRGDRHELDAVWTPATDYILEQGNWIFALRTVQLSPDSDLTPEFGSRQYAYARPEDYVRLAGIGNDNNFWSESWDFQPEGEVWYTTNSSLFIRYVSNDPMFGYNMGLWPATFCEAHGAYLAFKSSLPITKDGQTKDKIFAYTDKFINRAKELGAIEMPTKFKPAGNWGASRGGGRIRPTFGGGRMRWPG